jgi:hypothetical protein
VLRALLGHSPLRKPNGIKKMEMIQPSICRHSVAGVRRLVTHLSERMDTLLRLVRELLTLEARLYGNDFDRWVALICML